MPCPGTEIPPFARKTLWVDQWTQVQSRFPMMSSPETLLPSPLILPLGDQALLVRFGDALSEAANRAALAFSRSVEAAGLPGVVETVPNLVSVLLRYDPLATDFDHLAGEVRLLFGKPEAEPETTRQHGVAVRFDGDDLAEVAASLRLTPAKFIAAHNSAPLRVLATGFAPGFIYCGFHLDELQAPRRTAVRPLVPAGTVLFAAGQTAIASTPIPTGWHVIGHTDFRNFDAAAEPPTRIAAGDEIVFEVLA